MTTGKHSDPASPDILNLWFKHLLSESHFSNPVSLPQGPSINLPYFLPQIFLECLPSARHFLRDAGGAGEGGLGRMQR